MLFEECLLDAEHVGLITDRECEDWGGVVVCLDAEGIEHCAGVVDVVEELVVDLGLRLEEFKRSQRGGGEGWGSGGGADVCGGVIA